MFEALRRQSVVVALACPMLSTLAHEAEAANVAYEGFDDPSLVDTILADAGHNPTALTAADVEIGALIAGDFDVFVISRNTTFFGASLQYVEAVGDYVAAGGNIVTEWSGVGMFFSSYAADIRPPIDETPQLGLFEGAVHAGWLHQRDTPINLIDPDHPTVAGLPDPFSEGIGTEFFLWVETSDADLQLVADFSGNGDFGFPLDEDLPCLAVGSKGGSAFVFGTWCWNDTLSGDGLNRLFFVNAVNFAAKGASPCPWDIDGSGTVGASDLLELLFTWGPCDDCDDCPADFDGNGNVGASDLLAMLFNWGPCPK